MKLKWDSSTEVIKTAKVITIERKLWYHTLFKVIYPYPKSTNNTTVYFWYKWNLINLTESWYTFCSMCPWFSSALFCCCCNIPVSRVICFAQTLQGNSCGTGKTQCWWINPGPTFIKPDQLDPWIKDQIKITLLSAITSLQLPNFVWCERDKPSHLTQNFVTVVAKLGAAEHFLVDPWSTDQTDLVWLKWDLMDMGTLHLY